VPAQTPIGPIIDIAAAADETFRKAPESKKKQEQQKEFGL
jgi:hypothetical protein